jgi:hypothetical protein
VEVALIQRYLLTLGRPTLALAVVIGALLLFSGVGSNLSRRFPWRFTLLGLALLLAVYPWLSGLFTPALLGLPLALRVIAVALLIAPLGLLMGVPFAPADAGDLILSWAVNGSASVSARWAATLARRWVLRRCCSSARVYRSRRCWLIDDPVNFDWQAVGGYRFALQKMERQRKDARAQRIIRRYELPNKRGLTGRIRL